LTHLFDHNDCWKTNQIIEAKFTSKSGGNFGGKGSRKLNIDSGRPSLPKVLEVMTKIKVITRKGAEQLWQELKITDIESLKKAAQEKKIQLLRGFSRAKEQKILEKIEELPPGMFI